MSDDRAPMTPEERDELASAYLDGEATAEEAALVEGDPRLSTLVEELQAVKDLVAAPVEPPSDEVRDQMIAQALDHRAPVVPLESARRRLRPMTPRARVVLAAAAVVAAIAIVGVTVFQQADRGTDDMFVADDAAPTDTALEAPASLAIPESADFAEESADSAAFDSDGALAAEPAPAEEMMVADEPAAAIESMEMADEPAAAPAEDESEAASEMADFESEEAAVTSGDVPLIFDTEDDLFMHVAELVTEPVEEGLDEMTATFDLVGCPQPHGGELKLVVHFAAVVEGTNVDVSVYEDNGELLISQNTPPPECTSIKPLTPLP